MNPLNNHRHSLILGIVLALILTVLIGGTHFNDPGLARWFHIVAGVFWIGLLYYFNVAQTPAMADAAADKGGPGGAGISKYVAPRALFWFRWGAVATWLGGAWLLGSSFLSAFSFGGIADPGGHSPYYLRTIGSGAWLGTIMLFNVWVLIWPNQKKILGMVAASDEEKARARKTAGMASRVNFVLSIPMIMCMAGATHGLPLLGQ
ncbi:MAG TPA: urate hydroxylase PuuD [Steroidobacteraceae bacterium]|nr:urate hydroxylase PuuD [Steroidobacteraceae bacterium]